MVLVAIETQPLAHRNPVTDTVHVIKVLQVVDHALARQ